MRKKSTWLGKTWLDEWQQLTTSSRWHRGKTIYQQHRLIDMRIREREITGLVKGSEVYRQQITCEQMETSELKKIQDAFLNDPVLMIKLYLKTADDNLEESIRSAFFIPNLKFQCTCPDEIAPCKHLAAIAMAVAEEIEAHPSNFLVFRGVPWHDILDSINFHNTTYEEEHNLNYSMVPLPPQENHIPLSRKGRFTPPFWVSPFPFTLMMEEIYTKVGEEIDEE